MFVRRAFFRWQIAAAIVLPLWILIGWSLFGNSGWQFLLLMLACGVLAASMLGLSAIVYARKEVRAARAVSWADAGILAAWHVSLIAIGFFTPATSFLAVAAVVLGLAAFWVAITEFLTEARRRVQSVFDTFQYAAQVPGSGSSSMPRMPRGAGFANPSASSEAFRPTPPSEVEYIVIDTDRSHHK